MMEHTLMDKIRSFFGFRQEPPPRNDFRNPIWGDDDDDGDELYEREAHINIYTDPQQLHQEITKQMNDMFKSLSGIFGGNMNMFFHDEGLDTFPAITDVSPDSEQLESNSIRNHYLKPGYHNRKSEPKEDIDLDGKISSQEISGLLKQKGDSKTSVTSVAPFDGNIVPGRSFCQTIITTSITKPDGTIETRRIVKNGDGVTEETITTSNTPGSEPRSPIHQGLDPISTSATIYNNILSEFSTRWNNLF